MASEIRVDKITSLSGVGTITPSSSGIDISGITTVATLKATTGIVTTLTATTGIVTTLTANTVTSLGAVSGTTGTFSGAVSGTTGTFTGNITASSSNIKTGDSSSSTNNRLQLGAATYGDLELYHDGTNSYIDNATNDLYIRNTGGSSDDIIIQAADNFNIQVQGSENAMVAYGDGAVELYHDNNKKIVTTSQGAAIGQVSTIPTMDSFSCQINAGNSGFIGNFHSGSNQQFILGLNQYYQGGYRAPDNNVSQQLQLYNKQFNFLTAPAPGSDNAVVTNTKILMIDDDGIKFGNDTAAANALDDYEEGTFTAGWFDDGGAFANYTTQYGQYTKIGNVVYFCVGLRIGSFTRTPNSGQICRVGNLPFVSREVGDDEEVVFNLYARLWGSGTPPETARIRQSSGSGSNHIEFYMDESQTGNDDALYGSDFATDASCRIIVNGFYYTS